jgi:hypothetical protein
MPTLSFSGQNATAEYLEPVAPFSSSESVVSGILIDVIDQELLHFSTAPGQRQTSRMVAHHYLINGPHSQSCFGVDWHTGGKSDFLVK